MSWTCSRCGEEHEGLPHDLAFDAPMHWDGGKSDNDELTDDLCVWTDDAAGPAFFIRGLLTLPVLDADDDFRYGVWSSLSGPRSSGSSSSGTTRADRGGPVLRLAVELDPGLPRHREPAAERDHRLARAPAELPAARRRPSAHPRAARGDHHEPRVRARRAEPAPGLAGKARSRRVASTKTRPPSSIQAFSNCARS